MHYPIVGIHKSTQALILVYTKVPFYVKKIGIFFYLANTFFVFYPVSSFLYFFYLFRFIPRYFENSFVIECYWYILNSFIFEDDIVCFFFVRLFLNLLVQDIISFYHLYFHQWCILLLIQQYKPHILQSTIYVQLVTSVNQVENWP